MVDLVYEKRMREGQLEGFWVEWGYCCEGRYHGMMSSQKKDDKDSFIE